MKKKKGNVINLIICGAAFIIMVVVLFMDGIDNILGAMARINPLFLVIAALCMVLYWLGEGTGLHIVAKELDPKTKFRTTMLVTMIGQYFNCITPGASGGQPMQAYTFCKRGMTLGTAMTALLSRFIVYQFTLTVYSVVFLVIELPQLAGGEHSGLIPLILIGFAVNTAVIAMLFMLAFFKKAALKAAHGVIGLLGKLHILKDPDKTTETADKELEKYYDNFIYIKSRPLMLIKMLLITAVQLFVYFSITYVIYLGFGLSGADLFTVISNQAFVLMISSFVPLPGAMGAAEGSYAAFFGGIFGKELTVVSTFIWRFLTFYFPIIVGIVINLVMSKNGDDLSGAREDSADSKGAAQTETRMPGASAAGLRIIDIEAAADNIGKVMSFIDDLLYDNACTLREITQAELITEELFVNIANYAYAPGTGRVEISAEVTSEPRLLTITFRDNGAEYDPLSRAESAGNIQADERAVSGLGLFLVQKNTNSMKYERRDGQNVLTVTKLLENTT